MVLQMVSYRVAHCITAPLLWRVSSPPARTSLARRRVRTRLLMPAVVVAACFVAVAGLRAWQLRTAQEELQKSRALQLATLSAQIFDATIAQTNTLLVSLGELLDPRARVEQNDAVLQRIIRAGPVRYANLWMADTLGHTLGAARSPIGGRKSFAIADRSYFRDAMRTRRFTVGDVVASRTLPGSPRVLTFAMPVIDTLTGRVLSVVGASMQVDSLEPVRTARSMLAGTVLTILDSSGTVVFRSLDPEHWIGRHFTIKGGRTGNAAVREGVGAGRSDDGVSRLAGFRSTALAPWVVYIGIPSAYTIDIVRNTFIRDVAVGLIISLILFAFSYRAALTVVTPIESLTADARAVADGDVARRSNLNSNDELGDLALAFNQMADNVVERSRELQRSQEQLLHSQKMDALGSFAGGIAHDFNNYIHSIMGYTELAAQSLPDGTQAQEDLREVLASATRAADLTRQILVFSRKQAVDPQQLDLRDVVQGIERMLQRLVGEDRRLEIVASVRPVPVTADPGELEQVIVNLVSNARDATKGGGLITLSTTARTLSDGSPVAELTVRDNGSGMTTDVRERIFDPFFTTKGRAQGTGLGLAIVYGIVEQTGGTITVDSSPGDGTTFTVRLPAGSSDEATIAPMTQHESIQRGSGSILLAEDDAAVRQTTQRMLQHAGYSVVTAVDGQAALDVIHASTVPFDLLLTDVVMPRLSGSELVSHVTRSHPEIAVLFMSGYADDVVVQENLAAHSITLIQKPFSAAVLLAEVRRALAGRAINA